jgi:PAS domain S-box-containing protein
MTLELNMDSMFQAFANASDGVLIINQDQRILYWNQAAEEILGYSQPEVAGRPCYDILEGRDNQGRLVCREYCRVAMTALQGGTVTNYDSSVRTKSGDMRWINMSTFILPTNSTGTGSVLVHLFRDVSKKKQDEQFIEHVLTAVNQLYNREFSQAVPPVSVAEQNSDLTDREREVLALLAQGFTFHQSGYGSNSYSKHPPEVPSSQSVRGGNLCPATRTDYQRLVQQKTVG